MSFITWKKDADELGKYQQIHSEHKGNLWTYEHTNQAEILTGQSVHFLFLSILFRKFGGEAKTVCILGHSDKLNQSW